MRRHRRYPTGPPATTVTVDTADLLVTVTGTDPRVDSRIGLPGRSCGEVGAFTAIGAQTSPRDTLLVGNSSRTFSGTNPVVIDVTADYMIRILTDGEGGTLSANSTLRTTRPSNAPLRQVGQFILIDKEGNQIE